MKLVRNPQFKYDPHDLEGGYAQPCREVIKWPLTGGKRMGQRYEDHDLLLNCNHTISESISPNLNMTFIDNISRILHVDCDRV